MIKTSLAWDDVGLVPTQCSTIEHREEVDLSTNILGMRLNFPILLAPMKTVVGREMAIAAWNQGLLPILPRAERVEQDIELIRSSPNTMPYFVSVPASQPSRLSGIRDAVSGICIDLANGFHIAVARAVDTVRITYPGKPIITGNIASLEGYRFLFDLGVDAVRVGIGSGAACRTSISTGIRSGSFSLVRQLAVWREAVGEGPLIIADGGIRGPADIIKALAAGADAVMCGRLFAGTRESPGEVIKFNGQLYKHFAGQASHAVKQSDKYIEGDDSLVSYSGSLDRMLSKIGDGMRSSMAYLNCRTIEDLRFLPDESFVILTNASHREGEVRI